MRPRPYDCPAPSGCTVSEAGAGEESRLPSPPWAAEPRPVKGAVTSRSVVANISGLELAYRDAAIAQLKS